MKQCTKCEQVFQDDGWQCPRCRFQPAMIDGRPAFAPELAFRNEGFKPEYFSRLYDLESKNFWFQSRNRLLLWALRKYFAPVGSFLEVGCGTGFVLSAVEEAFPHARTGGSEIYSAALSYVATRTRRSGLFQMDARQIPYCEEFDVIGAFDVLEHIREDEAVLRQIHKAVRGGGGVILTVPQHRFLWSAVDDLSHHVRRYSAKELRETMTRCGFRIVRMTSFVSLLLPLLMLSRAQVPADGSSFDLSRELRIRGWKNTVLANVLSAERGLIGLGMNFPFGGSLIVVAVKQP